MAQLDQDQARLRGLLQNQPPLEGTGSYTFEDGSRYDGSWKNFLPHGKGTYTWPGGTVYTGTFKEGKVDGIGELMRKNAGILPYSERGRCAQMVFKYSGGFSNGCAAGQGTMTYPLDEMRTNSAEINTRFEGNFAQGAAQGAGTFIYPSGSTAGEWNAGDYLQN